MSDTLIAPSPEVLSSFCATCSAPSSAQCLENSEHIQLSSEYVARCCRSHLNNIAVNLPVWVVNLPVVSLAADPPSFNSGATASAAVADVDHLITTLVEALREAQPGGKTEREGLCAAQAEYEAATRYAELRRSEMVESVTREAATAAAALRAELDDLRATAAAISSNTQQLLHAASQLSDADVIALVMPSHGAFESSSADGSGHRLLLAQAAALRAHVSTLPHAPLQVAGSRGALQVAKARSSGSSLGLMLGAPLDPHQLQQGQPHTHHVADHNHSHSSLKSGTRTLGGASTMSLLSHGISLGGCTTVTDVGEEEGDVDDDDTGFDRRVSHLPSDDATTPQAAPAAASVAPLRMPAPAPAATPTLPRTDVDALSAQFWALPPLALEPLTDPVFLQNSRSKSQEIQSQQQQQQQATPRDPLPRSSQLWAGGCPPQATATTVFMAVTASGGGLGQTQTIPWQTGGGQASRWRLDSGLEPPPPPPPPPPRLLSGPAAAAPEARLATPLSASSSAFTLDGQVQTVPHQGRGSWASPVAQPFVPSLPQPPVAGWSGPDSAVAEPVDPPAAAASAAAVFSPLVLGGGHLQLPGVHHITPAFSTDGTLFVPGGDEPVLYVVPPTDQTPTGQLEDSGPASILSCIPFGVRRCTAVVHEPRSDALVLGSSFMSDPLVLAVSRGAGVMWRYRPPGDRGATYSVAIDGRAGIVVFPAGDGVHVLRLRDGIPCMPPFQVRFPHSVAVDDSASIVYISCLYRSGCNAVLVCHWNGGRLVPVSWLTCTENSAAVATSRWMHLATVPATAAFPVPLLLVAAQDSPLLHVVAPHEDRVVFSLHLPGVSIRGVACDPTGGRVMLADSATKAALMLPFPFPGMAFPFPARAASGSTGPVLAPHR